MITDFKDFIIDGDGVLQEYLGDGGDIVIPDGVKVIASDAFQNCENIRTLLIPDSVETIEKYAFSCFSYGYIQKISIGNGVSEIGKEAFLEFWNVEVFECKNAQLKHFMRDGFGGFCFYPFHTVFRNPESFSKDALEECIEEFSSHSLEDIASYIEDITFSEMKFLEEHGLLSEDEDEEWLVFLRRHGKTECAEELVRYFSERYGDSTFGETVHVSPHPDFEIENGVLFKYRGKGGNIVIPDGVKVIASHAFLMGDVFDWTYSVPIETLVIPDSVEKIRECAFYGVLGFVKSVHIGKGIRKIGDKALRSFGNVGIFEFSGKFPILKAFLFYSWDAPSVPFHTVFRNPDSFHLKDIADCIAKFDLFLAYDEILAHEKERNNYFWQEYLIDITLPEMLFLAKHRLIPIEKWEDWLAVLRKYGKFECMAVLFAYWANVHASERINSDENSDFEIKTGVLVKYKGESEHVVIPDGVREIAEIAFSDCNFIRSITVPDSVERIRSYAFYLKENSIKKFRLGNGLTYIGECAFKDLHSLEVFEYAGELPVFRGFFVGDRHSVMIEDGNAPFHTVFRNPQSFSSDELEECISCFPSKSDWNGEISYEIWIENFIRDVTLPELQFLEQRDLIPVSKAEFWLDIFRKYFKIECMAQFLEYIAKSGKKEDDLKLELDDGDDDA